ncbi:NTP transferase domain-containing protein [Rathayibacter sp. VKM Ac-2630]|uniref:NTP transferase domain-containing protein n=1 Tax=Rathayibacter sp. VKM Ac-2630 TaxID=1938617 RepID=UPI000981C7E2|nr:NTP transferase domain-containing protein [Rathayibacter sp. VKM Ac-2630]
MTGRWSAVVVFKGRGSSKTRLELDGRAALAEAFLLDTLAAVAVADRIAAVVLVTSDETAASRARDENPGLVVVPDPGALNPAVTAGIEAALLLDQTARVVALTGDLPALRPADLDGVLAAAAPLPAVVATGPERAPRRSSSRRRSASSRRSARDPSPATGRRAAGSSTCPASPRCDSTSTRSRTCGTRSRPESAPGPRSCSLRLLELSRRAGPARTRP